MSTLLEGWRLPTTCLTELIQSWKQDDSFYHSVPNPLTHLWLKIFMLVNIIDASQDYRKFCICHHESNIRWINLHVRSLMLNHMLKGVNFNIIA